MAKRENKKKKGCGRNRHRGKMPLVLNGLEQTWGFDGGTWEAGTLEAEAGANGRTFQIRETTRSYRLLDAHL